MNDILSVGATCTYLRPIALDILKLHRGLTLKMVVWSQHPRSVQDDSEALEVYCAPGRLGLDAMGKIRE